MKVRVHPTLKMYRETDFAGIDDERVEEVEIPVGKHFAHACMSEFLGEDGSGTMLFDDDFEVKSEGIVQRYPLAGTYEHCRSANNADPMRKVTFLLVADNSFTVKHNWMEQGFGYGQSDCPRALDIVDSKAVTE